MTERECKPPWWRWYDPPAWFPRWLHLATCTFCRRFRAHVRKARREREAAVPP